MSEPSAGSEHAAPPENLVVWADGRLVGPGDASLSAVDHGITVGDGVFETCAVFDDHAFALTRHLRRLARSAAGLGLEAPDEVLVRDGVAQVLAEARTRADAGGGEVGRLRITVTAGIGPLGSGRTPGAQTVVVAAGPAKIVAHGRAVRSPWTRNERSAVAGLKTTSYAENVVALADAVAKDGDEALLANTAGELCEGTGANVFVERADELVTPLLSSGCLAGITRELLLEWADEEGLPVREARPGELPFGVLDEVTEGRANLLLTGSVRNVQPVTWLDGVALQAGTVSLAARELFERHRRERLDP
ncbi:aminotransferase class IV [Cellulosimicrobium arenosum]|uniref:Aminotransferase class IV n=1 Tax=Cellulosimicrobium arenosum TaxID=2708133 RepID=A0A927IZ09_9MICO|nr:aminotransferase class IV [Cellulosimicrobium arenosum]MBD8077933.1 aminotransferase class IV [Cellulosimicrobium arenosum]